VNYCFTRNALVTSGLLLTTYKADIATNKNRTGAYKNGVPRPVIGGLKESRIPELG